MSFTPPVFQTKPADTISIGPFGRQKVTTTQTIWDHKNIHSHYSDLWEEMTNGGGSISHLPNESAVALEVGTASGDYAIRSTRRYLAYVSGNGHNPFQTFVFPPAQANLVVEAGYYDGPADPSGATWGNGIFLRQEDSTISLVIRSDVNENPLGSRAVNEQIITQANWNIDKLDGTGPSGLTLDLTKAQIFEPDFQWLGVGRIRFTLNIDGEAILVHEDLNANNDTAVYMRTPSLPIRYLIRNKGVTASAATLKEICSSVKSEGQYTLPGIERSVDTGGLVTKRAITATEAPILILRLANTINGMKNRKIIRFLESNYSAETRGALFRIAHVHGQTSVDAEWRTSDGAVNGTPGVVTGDSCIEYAYRDSATTGNPTITGGEIHFVKPKYVASGQGGRALGDSSDVTFINNHSFISQNFDSTKSELFVVYASGDGGASSVWAALDFVEFE
jgi:hypothetical protein